METLIRDLLTFSRTVHREERTLVRADLSAALEEALSVLKDRLEESGAIVTSSQLPVVLGDPSQLAHVFQNVVSNAIKYRKKEVQLQLTIDTVQRQNEWIISFQDN